MSRYLFSTFGWIAPMVMQRRGPGQRGQGRPHKGDRDSIMIRPRQSLGELIRAQADDAGMTITDFVATHMADALGRPDLAPEEPTRSKAQEVLPLADTA